METAMLVVAIDSLVIAALGLGFEIGKHSKGDDK